MSVLATLRPDSWSSTYAPPITVGGDLDDVLRDDNDATWYESHFGAGNQLGAIYTLNWSPLDLPAGARVEWARFRSRIALVGNYNERMGLWYPGTSEEMIVTRDGAVRAWTGQTRARNPNSGRDWSDSDLEGITATIQFYDLVDDPSTWWDGYLYALYLDVSYKRAGSVAVAVDSATLATSHPTVTWVPTAPDTTTPQERWRMRVYTEAQYGVANFDPTNPAKYPPTWDSGDVFSSSQRSAQVGATLVSGTRYRAYVWAAQPWAGTAGVWWNPAPAYAEFLILLPPIQTPRIESLVADPVTASVIVDTGNDFVQDPDDLASYVVERSADGGVTWAHVIGTPTIEGGVSQRIVDYEAPRARPLLYRLRAGSLTNSSPWTEPREVELAIDGIWLKAPADPALNARIRVVGNGRTRPEPQEVSDVLGDDKAVITSDGVKANRGKLTVQTQTVDEYDQLDALLIYGGVLLLQDPFGKQWYVRTGGVHEFEQLRSVPDDHRFPVRHLHRVGFGWTETRRPHALSI